MDYAGRVQVLRDEWLRRSSLLPPASSRQSRGRGRKGNTRRPKIDGSMLVRMRMIRDVLTIGVGVDEEEFFHEWGQQSAINAVVKQLRHVKCSPVFTMPSFPIQIYGASSTVHFDSSEPSYWKHLANVLRMKKNTLRSALSFLIQRGMVSCPELYRGVMSCDAQVIANAVKAQPHVVCLVSCVGTKAVPIDSPTLAGTSFALSLAKKENSKRSGDGAGGAVLDKLASPCYNVKTHDSTAGGETPHSRQSSVEVTTHRKTASGTVFPKPAVAIAHGACAPLDAKDVLCVTPVDLKLKLLTPFMYHHSILFKKLDTYLTTATVEPFSSSSAGVFADIAGRGEFYSFTVEGASVHDLAKDLQFANAVVTNKYTKLSLARKRMLSPLVYDVLALLDFMQNNYTVPVGSPLDIEAVQEMRRNLVRMRRGDYNELARDAEANRRKLKESAANAEQTATSESAAARAAEGEPAVTGAADAAGHGPRHDLTSEPQAEAELARTLGEGATTGPEVPSNYNDPGRDTGLP